VVAVVLAHAVAIGGMALLLRWRAGRWWGVMRHV
jgi:hypothetical protein